MDPQNYCKNQLSLHRHRSWHMGELSHMSYTERNQVALGKAEQSETDIIITRKTRISVWNTEDSILLAKIESQKVLFIKNTAESATVSFKEIN